MDDQSRAPDRVEPGTHATFTIFHDGRFWVGVLELDDGRRLRSARHVFGPEPTDPELLDFARRGYLGLARWADGATAVASAGPPAPPGNPKRRAREAARAAATPRPSTRAQEALKATTDAHRRAARASNRAHRDEERDRRRALRRARARARHRGR